MTTGRQTLLETVLTRAAEALGDITTPVFARYYAEFPEARARFAELNPGASHQLEGQMIEQVLYCLMNWLDSPGEIEITLLGSVPHHAETLKVAPRLYGALVEATVTVLAGTIPEDCPEERALLAGLHAELDGIIAQGASFARKPVAAPSS